MTRIARSEMSIGEIAEHYQLTYAGISKHIEVLGNADLITKRPRGKEQLVVIVPITVTVAQEHIERLAECWRGAFNTLDELPKEG